MVVVDIGNTFTRVAAFSGDRIRSRSSLPTASLTVDEAATALSAAAEGGVERIVSVASVVPAATELVLEAVSRLGLSARPICAGTERILPHRLTTPQTTGVDRLLAALAAGANAAAGHGGYVVVQCGSAATVDAVDQDGVFLGGYILPGPGMWLAGMSAAAQLPDLSGARPDWEAVQPGDNTRDAMLHGLHAALPAAVAAAVDTLAARAGLAGSAPVILTGGWGRAVLPRLTRPHEYDGDLLLHGIRIFAGRDRGEEKTA